MAEKDAETAEGSFIHPSWVKQIIRAPGAPPPADPGPPPLGRLFFTKEELDERRRLRAERAKKSNK